MLGTADSPLRVAIIGAGPSGFYAAGHLLKNKHHPDLVAEVDLYDKLPTPFGLVRAGVAPDHPKIKAVTRVYDKTAAHPNFRFYGGVEIGKHITRDELVDRYHAVIYTTGAQTDRRLGIDGEDLPGSVPATDFVAWYNGHPDAHAHEFDLSSQRAVVVGNGNVAIDVARMLLLDHEELGATDTADHAISGITESAIEEVVILGRRGPAQAAFTNPEILELGVMKGVDIVVDPADLELDPVSAASLEVEGNGTARKNVEILRGYAARELSGAPKRIVLRFFASPAEIQGDGKVEQIVLERNELVQENGVQKARSTGERETLETGLVFRAVGYMGVPIPGVPFEGRSGLIRNVEGRVVSEDGTTHHGEYTAGWVKRGPSGVIGTNKKCAHDTVDELFIDLEAGTLTGAGNTDRDAIDQLLRERVPHLVDWTGWQAIDAAETAAGEPHGRPRVKHVTIETLLEAAGGAGIPSR